MLLVCAWIPLLCGALEPVLRRFRRSIREGYAVAVATITTLAIWSTALAGGDTSITLFRLTDTLACTLSLDGAGRIYLLLIATLWPFATLYAVEYMRHEPREGHFMAMYLMTYGVAILFACADNLLTLYIFYELLTLVTIPLVLHKRDNASVHAAWRYMLYLFGGAALGFVTLIAIGPGAGQSFAYHGVLSDLSLSAARALYLIAFVGFGVKAAVFPLCRWLPGASVAPTPVTALLHAVAVVNAGVFAVMRLTYFVFDMDQIVGSYAQAVALGLSAITVAYGAILAVRDQNLKRRLAWSTVSNLGYMLVGMTLATESGFIGGMAHMVFHGLIKFVLFGCAGGILVKTGFTTIRQMHGLARRMRWTFAYFTFAALALCGVPPLIAFVSKYWLITAALQVGGVMPWLGAIALLISAVLTAIYLLAAVLPAYFLRPSAKIEPAESSADIGVGMKIALGAAALMIVGVSFVPSVVMDAIRAIPVG